MSVIASTTLLARRAAEAHRRRDALRAQREHASRALPDWAVMPLRIAGMSASEIDSVLRNQAEAENEAGIEQIDAGPKGAVIAFRNKSFANPDGLIAFIREHSKQVKLHPDHRLIYYANWQTPEARLHGARDLLQKLVKIAAAVKQAA